MLTPGSQVYRDRNGWPGWAAAILVLWATASPGGEWPQYRGPTGDGISTEAIATTWATNSPGFVVWTNTTLTNGFSSFAVSEGRAVTLLSRQVGGSRKEVCAAVDAATGTNLWATVIDNAPWDPGLVNGAGGEGNVPCQKGDGPRTTPSVKDGRVFALSGLLHLVCLNATNGSVIWSNNLVSLYGASSISWENGASPRLDNDLLFVNLNTANANLTLLAFNVTNGAVVWQSQNEPATHSTPLVTTIHGVRQVLFATVSNVVSLDRTTGELLWRYWYPFSPVDSAMGAAPVVSSNVVFVTAAYGTRGAAAARVTLSNSVWTVTPLWFKTSQGSVTFKSTWMTPVCYEGHLYGQFSDKGYTNTPLNCIELATGNLKWSTNRFGMGGLILVNTNLLVLTENGQLVLVRPNPSAYTELARYRAFEFTASAPGKCWNSPAYSDGRLYVRSTRGGLSVNVASAVATPPSLVGVGASNVMTTAATLYGSVNPNGATSAAWFQWGPTASYGSNTPVFNNLTGNAAVPVSHSLSGLPPDTTLHFRLVATNSAGVTNSADRTFTTLPRPPQLRLLSPRFLNSTQLQLLVTTTNGVPLDSNRPPRIEVRATNTLGAPASTWPRLATGLTLTTNGWGWMTDLINAGQTRLFYILLEQP